MSSTRPLDPKAIGIHKRRTHFIRKRAYAQVFEDSGYPDLARSLRDCQETEVLACCSSCGKSWYILNHCRQRICPLCSYTRAQERAKFITLMTRQMHHPKMLTLTIPRWTDNPGDGIAYLRDCFNKLRRHILFSKVRGGCYNIEVKPKDGGWHIHIHVMLDCAYIPYQKIFRAWRQITHVHVPQVDIRSADTKQAREYLCKDASKSVAFDTNPRDIVRWYEATKGRRLFATFGKWYNATLDDLEEPELFAPLKPCCPNCGSEKSVFLARDGPWIYGVEDWQTVWAAFSLPDGETRRLPFANDMIENPHPELDDAPEKKPDNPQEQLV